MKLEQEQVPGSKKLEQRPDTTLYRTEQGNVSWGKGVKVWVEIEKNPDNTFNVQAVIDDPMKVIEDTLDILPTAIMNMGDAKEAKKKADDLFENRDKWAEGYGA
ncbi:hypothetical protein JW977_02505 [Candidatus Falkowbacteria bacterium]|nr:hypothetical protein [Candidatus Falkowbacteria bacterium]